MNPTLSKILILLLVTIIMIKFYHHAFSEEKLLPKLIKQEMVEKKENYIKNRYYFLNNNIFQYSSYIIIDKDEQNQITYRIEAIIEHSYLYISDFGSKENYKCLAKSFQTNQIIEIIELDAIDSVEINLYKENRKLIFSFKLENFKSYSQDPTNFNLYYIVIAIIWKSDFDKSLDLVNFSNKLDKLDNNLVQPYHLIRFQIPTIIKAQNPRLPTVSLCATYTYGTLPPEIYTWIDFNLAIGIKKILIYDGIIL
jgi:hypothetical protein